jgi:hypothetical protein
LACKGKRLAHRSKSASKIPFIRARPVAKRLFGSAPRAAGPKGWRSVSQLYKAYCNINFATQGADGSRAMPIKRVGAVEVRLVEFASSGKENDPEVWLELYQHDTHTTVDSYLCDDLDEAEPMLEYLISSAAQYSGPSPTLG